MAVPTPKKKINGDSNENSVERMASVTAVTVLMMLVGVQMLIMSVKVTLMVGVEERRAVISEMVAVITVIGEGG